MHQDKNSQDQNVSQFKYDYSDLILEEPRDHINILREKVSRIAHSKIKGQNYTDPQDNYLEEQANKILKMSREYPEEQSLYEKMQENMMNAKHYSQVKIAFFDLELSGSSSEEIQPNYQSPDQVVVISTGDPTIFTFYILGKINSKERVQPFINILYSFKGADEPQILLVYIQDSYRIYKMKVSSLIRKYEIKAQGNGCTMNSQEIILNQNEQILLNQSFHFNFINKQLCKIGQLEQIIFYSLLSQTQQILQNKQLKLQELKKQQGISQQFIEVICKTDNFDSLQKCLKLTLKLIDSFQIQNIKNCNKNHYNIYKLLAKIYMVANFVPFINPSQQIYRKNVMMKLLELIDNKNIKIIGEEQSNQLFRRIVENIKTNYKDYSAFLILEELTARKNNILVHHYDHLQFLNESLIQFCKSLQDQLAAQIFTAYYYYQFSNSPDKIKYIIQGIKPNYRDINIHSSSRLRVKSVLLFMILASDKIKIMELKYDLFLKFVKLYPLIKKLESEQNKIPQYILKDIKLQIGKNIKKLTQQKQFGKIIQILGYIYLDQEVSKDLFQIPQKERDLKNWLDLIITNKSIDETSLKKINSQIFIKAIQQKLQIPIYEKFIKCLAKYKFLTPIRILNEGLTDKFFQSESNQNQFDKLLMPVIQKFYSDENGQIVNNWKDNFNNKINVHINEKMMEVLIRQKKSHSSAYTFNNFLSQLQKFVDSDFFNIDQKERLKVVVLVQNMSEDKGPIKSYLMKKQKLYLKIMLKIQNDKKDSRNQYVKVGIAAIRQQINNKELTYWQINDIIPIPMLQKDIERLSKLLSPEVYNTLKQQQAYVYEKINRLRKIQKFLAQIQTKFFQVNKQEVQIKKRQLFKSIDSLQMIKFHKAKETSNIYSSLPERCLTLCRFNFFYKNFDLSITSLQQIVELVKDRDQQIGRIIKDIVGGLQKKQVLLDKYNFFQFEKLSSQEIQTFLEICQQNKQKLQILELIKKNNRLRFFKQISKCFINLFANDQKYGHCLESNYQILKLCERIQSYKAGERISFSEYQTKFDMMQQIFKNLKLNISEREIDEMVEIMPISQIVKKSYSLSNLPTKEASSILVTIIIVNQHLQDFTLLKSYKKKMLSLKENFLSNSNQQFTLKPWDFKNYKFVIEFWQKISCNLYGQTSNIQRIISLIKEYNEKLSILKQDGFNNKIIRILGNVSQFQKAYEVFKNPKLQKNVDMKKLVSSSRIIITLLAMDYTCTIKLEVKLTENILNQLQLFQLDKYKDQALIRQNKLQEFGQQDRQEVRAIATTFLKMHTCLYHIQDRLNDLINSGYIFMHNINKLLIIKDMNLNEMEDYLEQISTQYKKWDLKLKLISGFSSKVTMLGGLKIRDFYYLLSNKQENADFKNFRYIAEPQMIKNFILKNKLKIKIQDSFSCLQLIEEFFKYLKTELDKVQIPAQDRQQHYIELFRFEEDKKDYISCLNQMKPEKLKNIQQGRILSCKNDTTSLDVQSFIERSIIDPDNQYILLGYDHLSQKLQSLAIEKIEKSLQTRNNRLKLCVAGKQTAHTLYRYINNKLTVTKKIEGDKMKQQNKEFVNFVKDRINNQLKYGQVRIYNSSHPGLGKTFTIVKEIQKNKKSVIYFPISGRTTSINLFNRLTKNLTNKSSYCILIQLYEIQNQSKNIVNDFIRQVVFLRSYEYNKQVCIIEKQCRVYIEIQDKEINESLPIIHYLSTSFSQICVNIQQFQLKLIQVTVQDIKISYILDHLEMFDNGTMDKADLPRKQQYKVIKLKPNLGLLKKYFEQKFPNDVTITYYQFKYWVDLFYQSCACFSGSYQISSQFFIKDYDEKIIKKYGLQKIRSEFFRVLLDNSIQFLTFSIQNLQNTKFQHSKSKIWQNKNNEIKFFIVPNNQSQWFSFIFRATDEIPKPIRSYFVSQAVAFKQNQKKTMEQLQKEIFNKFELRNLQKVNKEQFEQRLQQIMQDISGNRSYRIKNDPGYVLNLDNFIKICLISYKMKVNIPILIQGEAGVGKTALLRHLTQHIFKYQFIPYTINAGVSQADLYKKIQEAQKKLNQVKELNKEKFIQKKICLFFDEFNTLPELGYIKQAMMENRFMGQQKKFFKNLIVFAACNPYRQTKKTHPQLAFIVKKPPLAMGEIIWNFGSLNAEEMNKYVKKMVSQLDQDMPGYRLVDLVCQIQNELNQLQFGSVSLRDIERFRQIYGWLKQKMPSISKIKLTPQISQFYEKKTLRAFAVALSISYFAKLNNRLTIKEELFKKIKDKLPKDFNLEIIKKIKNFQQEDFCSRLKINYQSVSLNSALKENIYTIFICVMKFIPILVVGNPGSSKSLAVRIFSDNFKELYEQPKNVDKWIKQLPNVFEFFFQGSESCSTSSVQKRFKDIKSFNQYNQEENKKNKKIPIFVFDEMGLAQKSADNPLKAIHEPLQLKPNKKNINNKEDRDMSFIGISNQDLDMSKMSRFLILRRTDLDIEDLKITSKQIFDGIIGKKNDNFSAVYLKNLSETYFIFLENWKSTQGHINQSIKNFFGLRDFYNLIRTLADYIKRQKNKNTLDKIDEFCEKAIYRNFNGFKDSYKIFLNIFSKKMRINSVQIKHNILKQIKQNLKQKCRRYPLIIIPNSFSKSIFSQTIAQNFKNSVIVTGSPFLEDLKKPEYITKNITQIMKIVENDHILVASSLNKTAQGALFDLFNKFFIKQEQNQIYRVALQQSGYSTNGIVAPNFNACVIMNSQDLMQQSSAFLNRFQKYEFKLDMINDEYIEKTLAKLTHVIEKIQQICKKQSIGHYRRQNLFINITQDSLKTLVIKQFYKNKGIETNQIIKQCILNISKLATKDFQYIFQYIIERRQEFQQVQMKYFKQGLEKKKQSEEKCKQAIIITTDQNIWKKNNSTDKIISLEIYKNQNQLKQEIKNYLSKNAIKGTLYIDFSRQSQTPGANLNDLPAFMVNKSQTRIEIDYILYVISECKKEINILGKQIVNKRIRIILNYNRVHNKGFTTISFMQGCQIFSLDGSNSSQLRKVFENVNMKQSIGNCLKCFKFGIEDIQETQVYKTIQSKFNLQMSKNQILQQLCKQAVASFSNDLNQISQQDILNCIKNAQNIVRYNSIVTALTKQLFLKKLQAPITYFIKNLTTSPQNIILHFAPNGKRQILQQLVLMDLQHQKEEQKNCEAIKNFISGVIGKRIQKIKRQYRQSKKQQEQLKQQKNITLKKPTFFPLSSIETNLLFSPEITLQIKEMTKQQKNSLNMPPSFKQFQANYNKKLKQAFGRQDIYTNYKALTRSTNSYWKKMLMADVMSIFLEQAKVPSKYIFKLIKHLNSLFEDKNQNNFLHKVVNIIGNFQSWTCVFKILSGLAQKQITKTVKPGKDRQINTTLLSYCYDQLSFTYTSIQSLNASNLNEKMKLFTQIHHSTFFEIQNLLKDNKKLQNSNEYHNMAITQQFITIWEAIQAKCAQNIYHTLRDLQTQKNVFYKLEILKNFMEKVTHNYPQNIKQVHQYLANKLFPKWFNKCKDQKQIQIVFNQFCTLCQNQSNFWFAHNSTGNIQIALNSLNLEFGYDNNKNIIKTLRKSDEQMKKQKLSLNNKLLFLLSKICIQKKFRNNLSILICNIFQMNLKRHSCLISKPQKGFTLNDLQDNLQLFKQLKEEILRGQNSLLKLFAFAYLKLYLLHYVQIAIPQNQICVQIDNILSNQKCKLTQNLRFYCLKILRKKFNAKQLSSKYINLGTFKWCKLLRDQMQQEQSRAIQVPKIPQNMEKSQIQLKITSFKQFQGRDVAFLDEIISEGSKSVEGRYIVFNFFMKYLYTLAYNKQYQASIINHVKSKQVEYTQKLGKQQYILILKYTISMFDDNYFVQKHENFDELQFVTLNNINWLLASRKIRSPFHSIFLQKGVFHQSIGKQISQSFMPCGPENNFILLAKQIEKDTKNNNIGVYICSKNCDFMYSHLNCGWPSQSRPCGACGETIGSAGGHSIARASQGGRRVMSQKFINKRQFYMGKYNACWKTMEQFWDAQRCYIQAQIYRMRTKSAVIMKPQIDKKRVQQKINLLGYRFNQKLDPNDPFSMSRISLNTSKIIMLCLESSLYSLVSLDIIKKEDYPKIFEMNDKDKILTKLKEKINQYIQHLKKVLFLNSKFYTWIFGIQAEFYKFLINFQIEYDRYVQSIQMQSSTVVSKLKQKLPGLTSDSYKQLYTDLIRVIESGITTKQFKQVQARKDMNARNQFTRQVLQQFVEKIVSQYSFQNKIAFVQARLQLQGKMQFPFDAFLTQAKYDQKKYEYTKILKIPSETLTFDQVMTKYEVIIKNKHPFLDYLIRNSANFSTLQAFFTIVEKCNLFAEKVNYQFTRGCTKKFSLNKFNQQECEGQIMLPKFFQSWKKVSNYLGPIQVGCKSYGRMNDQFSDKSQVYNFLLDDTLKQNANGKIIAGIYHNFAVLHNDVLNVLKTRKNLIQKYKRMNFFVEDYKISPQNIKNQECILIKQQDIINKILQASVPSIKYGQNLVYHNFDLCQAYFLMKLKGRSEMETKIQDYNSVQYVGQNFSAGTKGTNTNAIGDVRDIIYQQISQQTKGNLMQTFRKLSQLDLFGLASQLQRLINKMGQQPNLLETSAALQIQKFIQINFDTLNLSRLRGQPIISKLSVNHIVPLYELIQKQMRKYLQDYIPDKYKKSLIEKHKNQIKQFVRSLPKQISEDKPTAQQVCAAVSNFVYRNLLSQFQPDDKKMFELIMNKQDLWPYSYDIYTKNMSLYSVPVLNQLTLINAFEVMKQIEFFVL